MHRVLLKHPYVFLIALTLLLRFGFLIWFRSGAHIRPQSTLSQMYFLQGCGIASGHGYVRPVTPSAYRQFSRICETPDLRLGEGFEPETAHPPGMPLLVAAVFQIIPSDHHLVVQLVNIALDAIGVALLYAMSNRLFSSIVALLAGTLFALSPPLAYASVSMTPDGLITVFVLGSAYCVVRAAGCRAHSPSYGRVLNERALRTSAWQGRTWLWLAAAGTILGVGSYLRPDFILLPVFLALGLWIYTRQAFRSFCALALMQILVLAVLSPWAHRNHALTGRWVFSSTMVGAVLITGLGEFSNPWGFGQLDEDRGEQAARQGLSSPWNSEADVFFRRLFVDSVTANPGAYLAAIAKRIPLMIATPYDSGLVNPWKGERLSELRRGGQDIYQILLSRPLYIARAYGDLLIMGAFNILCILALAYALTRAKSGALPAVAFAVSPHLYNVLSHAFTHLEARMLLPTAYGLLIVLAYVAVEAWRSRQAPDPVQNTLMSTQPI